MKSTDKVKQSSVRKYNQLRRELQAIIPTLQHRLECIESGSELTYHDMKTTASMAQQLATYCTELYTEIKLTK